MTILTITKNLLNLIYPVHCYICKKPLDASAEHGICDPCRAGIRRAPLMQDDAHSACIYEGAIKELIHLFKYNGRVALGRFFGEVMTDFLKTNSGILEDIDMITFVPLHNSRLRERGFNQSRILAFHISKESGIPLSDILEKRRRTRNQNELSRNERLANLKGVFGLKKKAGSIKGCRILLVDDVMTTGATLDECTGVLLRSGAGSVRCLTLARGI